MTFILPVTPDSMTADEFVVWLRDFLTLNETVATTTGLTPSHVRGIHKYLALVPETSKMNQDLTAIAVRTLNEAFNADPAAVRALLCVRVPCNQALIDHPTIVCDDAGSLPDGYYDVGPLGIINGILTAMGAGRVASEFGDPDEKGRAKMTGFVPYPEGIPAK